MARAEGVDGRSFYEKMQKQLEERWIKDDFLINSYNKKQLSNRIGMSPFKFGFVIWDYKNIFKKTLRNKRFSNIKNILSDDPLKYKRWRGTKGKFYGIPFQYIEQVPVWTKTANYDENNEVMGRFEGQSIYSNSANQDLSITLTYYAESSKGSGYETSRDSLRSITTDDWTLGAIDRFILQLKSLVFPQYDGKYSPPLKVMMNIGNMYVDFPVIIKSVSVEDQAPYEMTTMRSMMRKVTIEMKSSYPSWQALSAPNIWTADNNAVFARQEFKK